MRITLIYINKEFVLSNKKNEEVFQENDFLFKVENMEDLWKPDQQKKIIGKICRFKNE